MKFWKNKSKITAIAFVLLLSFGVMFVALPIVGAHDPSWQIPTYAYLGVSPNPVGVDQTVFILMWIDKIPPTAGGIGGERWENFNIVVTKPDDTTEDLGLFTSDATSSTYTLYTPDQVGTYTFNFTFPGQVADLYGPTGIPGIPSANENDTYLASTTTETLTVQADPVAEPPAYPLPSRFWTRPIEGQNTPWSSVASNWLGWGSGQIVGGGNWGGGGVQPDGIAPNSPHIMWTKPLQDGGVVGGTYSIDGVGYYSGLSYEGRFNNPLVVGGRLFYDTPLSDNPTAGPYVAVDLTTGETLWTRDDISPSFGQLYLYESFNQHGVIGDGYLWQTQGRTWRAMDPRTGVNLFNLTNVPSGTPVYSPNGEIQRYVLNYAERSLSLWTSAALPNSSLVSIPGTGTDAYQYRPIGKEVNMENNTLWNVTIPDLPGLGNPAILSVIPDDLVFGTSTAFPPFFGFGTPDPYTFWAINLNESKGDVGELLWIQNYTAPSGNQTLVFLGTPNVVNRNQQVDAVNRVFFATVKETMQWYGYDLDTGEMLWGPIGDFRDFQYYGTTSNPPAPGYVYNGKFYVAGYGGELHCYNSRTGALEWVYNNTNSGEETPWGNYPLFVSTFADGKIYLFSSEHSPNSPLYKGSRIRAVNATDGTEIWTMLGWFASSSFGQLGSPIADGYYIFFNIYDNQIYCIGKGPSKTTVTAAPKVVSSGSSIIVEGTVTDQSAGAKRKVESGEFSVVPAMADEYMGEWMEYVYMQKPIPAMAQGVTVHLYAIDPNGNYQDIGETHTDQWGNFGKSWKPPVPGDYLIIAEFTGTESYWPSSDSTYLAVNPAPSAGQPMETEEPTTPAPPTTEEPSTAPPTTEEPTAVPTEAPVITTEVLIIAAVGVAAIIGVGAYWVLRRRK